MALTALRSIRNAITTRRPPQRLHSGTSSRKTRRSSSAQGSREGGRARAAAFDPRSPGGSTGPSDSGQRLPSLGLNWPGPEHRRRLDPESAFATFTKQWLRAVSKGCYYLPLQYRWQ